MRVFHEKSALVKDDEDDAPPGGILHTSFFHSLSLPLHHPHSLHTHTLFLFDSKVGKIRGEKGGEGFLLPSGLVT